jgi:uncharacterized BrkB/YihY/UPF0761 family membrane protein
LFPLFLYAYTRDAFAKVPQGTFALLFKALLLGILALLALPADLGQSLAVAGVRPSPGSRFLSTYNPRTPVLYGGVYAAAILLFSPSPAPSYPLAALGSFFVGVSYVCFAYLLSLYLSGRASADAPRDPSPPKHTRTRTRDNHERIN